MQYVRAKVAGPLPMRDALTREQVEPGDYVVLLVRDPLASKLPRCPRHPKRGIRKPDEACSCHATLLDPLLETGAIADVKPFDPNAKPKTEK